MTPETLQRWHDRYGGRVRVGIGLVLFGACLLAGLSVRNPAGCQVEGRCYPALHAFAAFPYGTALLFLIDPLLPRRGSRIVWGVWALLLMGLLGWLRASSPA